VRPRRKGALQLRAYGTAPRCGAPVASVTTR
jgi:hypothetical protein